VWERRGEWRIVEDRREEVRKQMDVPLQMATFCRVGDHILEHVSIGGSTEM
jgi:hypothetical protein